MPPSPLWGRSPCTACGAAEVQLGDAACVIGLGLVGQLVVRLLIAAGVRVVGVVVSRAHDGIDDALQLVKGQRERLLDARTASAVVDAAVKPKRRCALTADNDLVVATCPSFTELSRARCGSSIEDP
jgi:hypothetical protein